MLLQMDSHPASPGSNTGPFMPSSFTCMNMPGVCAIYNIIQVCIYDTQPVLHTHIYIYLSIHTDTLIQSGCEMGSPNGSFTVSSLGFYIAATSKVISGPGLTCLLVVGFTS